MERRTPRPLLPVILLLLLVVAVATVAGGDAAPQTVTTASVGDDLAALIQRLIRLGISILEEFFRWAELSSGGR